MRQHTFRLQTLQIGINSVNVVVEPGGMLFVNAAQLFYDWVFHRVILPLAEEVSSRDFGATAAKQ
jgi:hypothetical protein